MAERQHRETVVIPAGRGTIFDDERRAARDRRADQDGLRRPARARRSARGRGRRTPASSASTRTRSTPQLLNKQDALRLRPALRRPDEGRDVPEEGLHRRERLPRGEARVPAGLASAPRSSASPAPTTRGSAGSRSSTTSSSPGSRASRRSSVIRSGARSTSSARRPSAQGHDIFTTIDHTIQANAEEVLRETVAKWHARSATAIVLDPRTGAVLAMAQAPGYNANDSSRVPQSLLSATDAVTDTFEPGSMFKLVTIAGALSEGLVTPRSTFRLPSSIQVADQVHPRRRAARHRDADRREDPVVLVERRRDHDRREARRAGSDEVDRQVRLRQADRHRLPR